MQSFFASLKQRCTDRESSQVGFKRLEYQIAEIAIKDGPSIWGDEEFNPIVPA
jgi:hypothetical protein